MYFFVFSEIFSIMHAFYHCELFMNCIFHRSRWPCFVLIDSVIVILRFHGTNLTILFIVHPPSYVDPMLFLDKFSGIGGRLFDSAFFFCS